MTPFDLGRDSQIIGHGPEVILYCHGFGVQRDSRGMYTELAQALTDNYTSVLFDFNHIAGQVVTLRTLSEQAAIVRQMLAWARATYQGATIHLIAHSLGCMVASLADDTKLGRVIFLAPPTHTTGGSARQYFLDYPGARLEGRLLTVPRRDGTTTIINLDYFDEMEHLAPATLIGAYAYLKPLTVIEALEEDVIRGADYTVLANTPGVILEAIHGDHNFTGAARAGLIDHVAKLLEG